MVMQGSLIFWKLLEAKESKAKIELSSDLIINDIDEIKNELLKIFKEYQSVQIEVTNLNKIDLAGLQLLYSFKNTLSKEEKTVEINIQIADDWKVWLPFSGIEYLH